MRGHGMRGRGRKIPGRNDAGWGGGGRTADFDAGFRIYTSVTFNPY